MAGVKDASTVIGKVDWSVEMAGRLAASTGL